MPDGIERKRFDPVAYFRSWRRKDWLALAALVIVVAVLAVPVYMPKNGCEVARAAYKCLPAKTVMAENCNYWGNWSCPHCEKDSSSCPDASLPQVEWYISGLCNVHNQLHADDQLDCTNLKAACNQATGQQTCGLA